jgi:ferredoxin
VETARQVSALGYPVTIIEKKGSEVGTGDAEVPPGAEILTDTALRALGGAVGGFRAVLRGPAGEYERMFGAIVVASGLLEPERTPYAPGKVVPLPGLMNRLTVLRGRGMPRSIAVLLDYEIDETTAGSEKAFRACIALRSGFDVPVSLLLREARVSAQGMESLYDEARIAGVCVVHYEGDPEIGVEGADAAVRFRDAVLGDMTSMSFGLLAISPRGLHATADLRLAEAAGIGMDPMGRFQENNIHLLPELSGRPGVFIVGDCRGESRPEVEARDAKNAALDVHLALSRKPQARTRAHPVVDGDLCALCLTCVRSCPAKAMRILAEEKRADCLVEACVSCGTCIGECPAGAITIPAWPDKSVLDRAVSAV